MVHIGAYRCKIGFMPVTKKLKKTVRRSISLPVETDAQIQKLARRQRQSANRVMENLIEVGLEAKEDEKQRFFELADRLRTASDPAELQHLKEELARMTFGS
jgi:predicted DNA-binding protein